MSLQATETIHVAYAFDDNYAEMSCVSMASMLSNTKHPVHFHIMESRLSTENKQIIATLHDKFPHGEWIFHHIGKQDISKFVVNTHFTIETYYRLLLPELLYNIDKIIYIDGDTVIERDIFDIWQIDLKSNLAGVVPDVFQSKFNRHKKALGLAENDLYFNAGVLLLNLKELRLFRLLKKAYFATPRLMKKFKKKNLFWHVDQEILNYLFNKKSVILPLKYNLQTCNSIPYDCDGIALNDWREAFMSPVVIHFNSASKPTRITKNYMPSPLWERYYHYKAMTPFANESDNIKIKKYHQYESMMNNALIQSNNTYFEYRKHMHFTALADKMDVILDGKRLALWGINKHIMHLIAILSTKDIYADIIVDGLERNRKRNVLHYTVNHPEELRGKYGEYFVLLCMENEEPAEQVGKILSDYGYKTNGYYHIFSPLWEEINVL
jgi:lipopolysaccharide biosynthesis glycosyltransferase